jgi:hypothetical protein
VCFLEAKNANKMASKKSKKGKTVPLANFLSLESKLVTVRVTNWSEIVDKEEADTIPIGNIA